MSELFNGVRAGRRSGGSPRTQRGGFGVGLIVGLLLGLALALGVALYVTKVPVPFINKVPHPPGQDAAEIEKNRNWDPNSPLYGKNPARPGGVASGVVAPAPAPALPAAGPNEPRALATPGASAPSSRRDPAAILGEAPAPKADDKAPRPPKFGDATPAAAGPDPFVYFVQAGAYGRTEDAEHQRAKLAMLGVESRLTEREQSGRTVYRVRIGPFEHRADADATKGRLAAAGVEAALVRVQR